MRRILSAATLLLLSTGGPAVAQSNSGFIVGPSLGYIKYQEETGITRGPTLALDATYRLGKYLGIGATVSVARAETDGTFFPAELTFRDTTVIYAVQQPLTAVHFAGTATGRLPLGAVQPYVTGGLGIYSISMDPQSTEDSRSFTEMLVGSPEWQGAQTAIPALA